MFSSNDEVKSFYQSYLYLKKVAKNDWNYNVSLDFIIDENCLRKFELGCSFLFYIIENNNVVNYIPKVVFQKHLNTESKVNSIWSIMQEFEFTYKGLWELSFYEYIDDLLINEDNIRAIINTLRTIKETNAINFTRLQRFLKFEPKLFQLVLRIIVERNEIQKEKLHIWMDLFSVHFDQLGDDLSLIKKSYLQQVNFNNHFDFNGDGFLNILKKDRNFLLEYVSNLYAEHPFGLSGYYENLNYIWQIADIESVLFDIFDLAIQREPYLGISSHFCNAFFRNLNGQEEIRARLFLMDYCNFNFTDAKKINIVVDIVRHSMKDMFEDILLLFLSLNQDLYIFKRIWWRGNGIGGSGKCNFSRY